MLNEESWRLASMGTLVGVALLQSACLGDDVVHARAKVVDEAFGSAIKSPLARRIPMAAFMLLQADLTTPQVRTLIVANSSEGVPSYQAFEVTFHASL